MIKKIYLNKYKKKYTFFFIFIIILILYLLTNILINKYILKINNKNKTSLKNISGYFEIKEEIKEIINFLKFTYKYKKIGAKIPKGILLIGLPGTGKTLLAKALAYESKVPYLNITGSDFIEMFVGLGAARVRYIFKKAKKLAPCIIFIDEIDAIGRKRSNININEEREQTLNQILVEMDGFENNNGIIIIAATNRIDVLDNALLRAGRFDRKIYLNLPSFKERIEILNYYLKKVKTKKINLSLISQLTIGFTGADLYNLINEAALLAVKMNINIINMNILENVLDKILLGRKCNLSLNIKEKEYIAYHEAGHTIIGYLISFDDFLHKVTIIPHENALGITLFIPKKENIHIVRTKIENKICIIYGGRIAEEIIYGINKISIGSCNDIKKATYLAINMVNKWGYSYKLGPILYDKKYNISEKTKYIINIEVNKILKRNYLRARFILLKNINLLLNIKEALIKYKILSLKEINKLIYI